MKSVKDNNSVIGNDQSLVDPMEQQPTLSLSNTQLFKSKIDEDGPHRRGSFNDFAALSPVKKTFDSTSPTLKKRITPLTRSATFKKRPQRAASSIISQSSGIEKEEPQPIQRFCTTNLKS